MPKLPHKRGMTHTHRHTQVTAAPHKSRPPSKARPGHGMVVENKSPKQSNANMNGILCTRIAM
eukprot:6250630-Amphidinium_carterae.2